MKTMWIAAFGAALVSLWPAVGEAQCSAFDMLQCASMGGVPDARNGQCWCDVYDWVPRRVANASNGDVGIVPIDGNGSDVVETVTREIGQFHRHSVMFYSDGRRTRHDTMYIFDDDDGSMDDPGGDYVTIYKPLIGKVRFDGDELQNGLPGAISQTIDDTVRRGRLSDTGLILKPAMRLVPSGGFFGGWSFQEVGRDQFEGAVTDARNESAYYKLGDYTEMDSMSLPWASDRDGDLRGSHCSGYITHYFREQGLGIADVFYPESLREDVAETLYSQVRTKCRNEVGLLAEIKHTCGNLANQVVNCFADLSCWDTKDTWRDAVGTGSAVSPDNLLPATFRYTGNVDYEWDGGTTLTNGSGPMVNQMGTTVDHPGLSGTEPGVAATSQSPFQRVAAMSMVGGYATLSHSVRL